MENTQRKQYCAPKLTDHGSVVEKTKGLIGWTYEYVGQLLCDEDLPIKPPPRDS